MTTWYQRVPESVKGIVAALTALALAYGVGAATAEAYNEAATKTYVRKAVHAAKVDADKALQPVLASVATVQAVQAAQLSERDRQQLADAAEQRRWKAVFRSLVSGEAADLEVDRLRKAQAAAFARTEYEKALKDGAQPEDAKEQAMDVVRARRR